MSQTTPDFLGLPPEVRFKISQYVYAEEDRIISTLAAINQSVRQEWLRYVFKGALHITFHLNGLNSRGLVEQGNPLQFDASDYSWCPLVYAGNEGRDGLRRKMWRPGLDVINDHIMFLGLRILGDGEHDDPGDEICMATINMWVLKRNLQSRSYLDLIIAPPYDTDKTARGYINAFKCFMDTEKSDLLTRTSPCFLEGFVTALTPHIHGLQINITVHHFRLAYYGL